MKSSPTLPAHLAKRLRDGREAYRKRLARCQEECSEPRVHALRVQTRRLLTLLTIIAELTGGDRYAKLSKSLSKRLVAFGPLRDVQVQQQLLVPLLKDHPEAEPFQRFLRRRERKLESRLKQHIRETRCSRLNRQLRKPQACLSKVPPENATPASVNRILTRAFEHVEQESRKMGQGNAEAIHRMRIEFKRYRYTIESLKPLLPAITKARLAQLKRFQDSAGEIQDLEILLKRIARAVRQRKVRPADIRGIRFRLLQLRAAKIASFLRHADLDTFRPQRWLAKPRYSLRNR